MPHFFAAHGSTSNLTGDVFLIDIALTDEVPYTIPAVVCPELYSSRIGSALAGELGIARSGDKALVKLVQTSFRTLDRHEFRPFPIDFSYAHPRLGPNYVQLGIDDLQNYFELQRFDPKEDEESPAFILLVPKPQYRSWCSVLPRVASQ